MSVEQLCSLIAEQDWVAAQKMIDDSKDKETLLSGTETGTADTLMMSLSHRAPDKLIFAILSGHEDAVYHKSATGSTALHHAVRYGASYDVVAKLIRMNPAALDIKNKCNKTPRDFLSRYTFDKRTTELMKKSTAAILKEQRRSHQPAEGKQDATQRWAAIHKSVPNVENQSTLEEIVVQFNELCENDKSGKHALTKTLDDIKVGDVHAPSVAWTLTLLPSDRDKLFKLVETLKKQTDPLERTHEGSIVLDSPQDHGPSWNGSSMAWFRSLEVEQLERRLSEKKADFEKLERRCLEQRIQIETMERLVLEKKMERLERMIRENNVSEKDKKNLEEP